MRHPTKADSFIKLKEMRVPVGAVLDVGVQTCTKELIDAFRDRHHVLMEPVVEWNQNIQRIYGKAGVSHEIVNVAVSDRDGEVTLQTLTVSDSQAITHARMIDGEREGPGYRTVATQRLDSIVSARELPRPYFLKIDVDGAELSVLAGGTKTLADCSVVVIETDVNNLVERARAVQSAGFQTFDFVDLSYYDGRFVQADMVFLNRKVVTELGLDLYKNGFDAKLWENYKP